MEKRFSCRNRIKKSRVTAYILACVLTFAVFAGCVPAEPSDKKAYTDSAEIKKEPSEPEEDDPSPEFRKFREDNLFPGDLPEEDLVKPAETIASIEDMIYALDYMAFYRIGDKVYFQIDPEFAEEIYNPYTVYQEAYRKADLADVYACQMDDAHYSDYGVIGLKYSMSRDIASEPPASVPETPVLASFDYEYPKDDRNNSADFGTEALSGDKDSGIKDKRLFFVTDDEIRESVSCENSEQLYYLAMNGYRPVPEPGSSAEGLYREAKKILAGLITEKMSDFQKIKAVYDWLTTEVKYDAATAYTTETYLVKEQAYYLEGVFLNHCAVCDGKAKACALMMNMLGIPCVRTTGVNEGGDHAWNMVRFDGKWYVLCTTYGQSDLSESLGYIVPNYSMLLSGAATPYEWYPADKHTDIEAQLEKEAFDIYEQMGRDDGLSLKIGSIEELENLMVQAAQSAKQYEKNGYKLEFTFTGDDPENFTEALTSYLSEKQGINAAAGKTERSYLIFVEP